MAKSAGGGGRSGRVGSGRKLSPQAARINVGDRVRIISPNSAGTGRKGIVQGKVNQFGNGAFMTVRLFSQPGVPSRSMPVRISSMRKISRNSPGADREFKD